MDSTAKKELDASTVKLKSYPYAKETLEQVKTRLMFLYRRGENNSTAIAHTTRIVNDRRKGFIKRIIKDMITQFRIQDRD